jgi:hypothetical protein
MAATMLHVNVLRAVVLTAFTTALLAGPISAHAAPPVTSVLMAAREKVVVDHRVTVRDDVTPLRILHVAPWNAGVAVGYAES